MSLPDRTFDLRCPECGNEQDFVICISVMANLYNSTDDFQSGTEADGDHEWNDESYARCNAQEGNCTWEGTVEELNKAYTAARAQEPTQCPM